jgi:hypothetical protein
VTWIPSFAVIFSVREILFPTGKTGFMAPTVIMLLLESLVALGLCYWLVNRKLMREGR